MSDKINLNEIKKTLSPFSLLYVEDNIGLQEKALVFFKKFFVTIHKANDGKSGLELFKKYRPSFVITDIQMPKMDGLEMAEALREIDPNVKIIITSAVDDKEFLFKTIKLELNGYLLKPFKIQEISTLLYKLGTKLHEERNKKVFHKYMHSIFNNQANLLMLIKNDAVLIANDLALEFFQTSSLKEFKEKFKSFDNFFAPHNSFLYHKTDSTKSCLDYAKENCEKLHNVKMIDKDGTPHHFILKMTHIEDGENFYIVSLTDITQLNLLGLYDEKSLENDKLLQDQNIIYNLFEAARESGAVIKFYNYYKGLTICNNGLVVKTKENYFTCKCTLMQQKAMLFEKKVIINCELFPYDLQSFEISNINLKSQTVDITKCIMIKTTPVQRQNLVLEPKPEHSISLFYNKHPFRTNIKIINISLESIRFNMEYLPAGFKENDEITINIVFSDFQQPLIINSQAFVLKIFKVQEKFNIVAKFSLSTSMHQKLTDYMASRQMQLVREFKAIETKT